MGMRTSTTKGQVKGYNGKLIKNQDWVSHISRINNLPAIGQVHHITGSSFAIEVPGWSRALYNIKEIGKYKIQLHKDEENNV